MAFKCFIHDKTPLKYFFFIQLSILNNLPLTTTVDALQPLPDAVWVLPPAPEGNLINVQLVLVDTLEQLTFNH